MQNGFLKKDVLLYEYFLLNESLAQPELVMGRGNPGVSSG